MLVENFKILETALFAKKVGEEITKSFDAGLKKYVDNEAVKLEPVFGFDSKTGEISTLLNTLKNYN